MIRRMLCMIVMAGLVAGLPSTGLCAAKKAVKKAKAAAAVKKAEMTDDVYVEVKSHEAAFLQAALKEKQALQLGTMEQKKQFAQYAQKKQEEFGGVRKKLLADLKVSEEDFKAFEGKLTSEGWDHLKAGLKEGIKNFKVEDKDGFNARAQKLAERITKRSGEIDARGTYTTAGTPAGK